MIPYKHKVGDVLEGDESVGDEKTCRALIINRRRIFADNFSQEQLMSKFTTHYMTWNLTETTPI